MTEVSYSLLDRRRDSSFRVHPSSALLSDHTVSQRALDPLELQCKSRHECNFQGSHLPWSFCHFQQPCGPEVSGLLPSYSWSWEWNPYSRTEDSRGRCKFLVVSNLSEQEIRQDRLWVWEDFDWIRLEWLCLPVLEGVCVLFLETSFLNRSLLQSPWLIQDPDHRLQVEGESHRRPRDPETAFEVIRWERAVECQWSFESGSPWGLPSRMEWQFQSSSSLL